MAKHSCTFEDSVISELVEDLYHLNPISVAFGVDGPLSSQYRREQFIKEHLHEYILHSGDKKTFHYVPILPLLSQLVKNKHIQNTIMQNKSPSDVSSAYKSFHDGSFLRANSFLHGGEFRLPPQGFEILRR